MLATPLATLPSVLPILQTPDTFFYQPTGELRLPFFLSILTDMPFPTYAASTELDAVNQILSSVGQAPVTTLDLQNPEVAITVNTLREVSKQVQLEGWTFNVERDYQLSRNPATKEVTYPSNTLASVSYTHLTLPTNA